MSLTSPAFVSELLNFIEEREQRLQTWGFYDVAFDDAELETLIATDGSEELRSAWERYVADGIDLRSVLTEMRYADLLQLVPDGSGRVRSRFAEGIRLLAHLRQRFSHRDWATGPRLVADLKIHLAPRRYPAVDISAAEAWQVMAPHAAQPAFQEAAFNALARRGDGGKFTFAGFQVRSFERIFKSYGSEDQSGTVVCATTGAGKTKAFYVPTLVAIAAELGGSMDVFTKVIAVYPRNVLLADQLREAVSEAAKLNPLLNSNGKRPITVGALLGDLPPAAQFDVPKSLFLKSWRYIRSRGWVVPFLRAPFHPDRGELIWLDSDRKAGRTTLYRVDAIDGEPEVPDGVIRLTRESLQDTPPDILFLSLEMMHRELGNPLWARTFGISADNKPRMLLFDEVHNYSGLGGAQAPWIIARWRQAAWLKGLHVVGLSATLKDAPKHLATIGCLSPERVVECVPADDELRPEGREYTVLVKGDPASGASLLATSIQAAMLQSRLLTPRHVPYPSKTELGGQSLYLRKVFGFADQLDSLNRWMPDLRHAESNRLAQYRAPPAQSGRVVPPAVERAMLADGQIWSLPDRLGHDLAQRAKVTRCSSQDPGADTASDIIVATASLEVGFDDPDVGAVIQHKAPRSIASYLQRRGRAGRTRGSRPTTLVVLSDLGRDRWLFQNSERLFQPDVEPIRVPVLNPYVQHVQATSFLLDWLGRRVGRPNPVSYLRRPGAYAADARKRAIACLKRLLDLKDDYAAFHRDLGWVVRHTQRFRNASTQEIDRVVDRMLWEAPRPVLRHAVPALLRKLEAEWRLADPASDGMIEDKGARQPLPSFIPSASFADLSASDVIIEFAGTSKANESRGVAQQLAESCPGRVSKRFAIDADEVGYWIQGSEALLTTPSPVVLGARTLFPDCLAIGAESASAALQPAGMSLVARPDDVKDSSNASWAWETRIPLIGDGRLLPLFIQPRWGNVFGEVRGYLHGDMNGATVQRRTSEGRFDILMDKGVEHRGVVILGTSSEEGVVSREPVGFDQTVDAVVFVVREDHLQERPHLDDATMGRLRQDYFKHRLLSSEILRSQASSFTLDFAWQTSLAMLTATALKQSCSLEAAQALLDDRRPAALGRVLSRMFSASAIDEDADDHEAGGKPRQRLEALWADTAAAAEIIRAERTLWEPLDDAFESWLRERHLRTLAEACLSAVQAIATDVGEDDLVVDVVETVGGAQIVISETAPGGIGQIEAFIQTAIEEEGTFERAVEYALDFCTRSHVSDRLQAAVSQARESGPVADAFVTARLARGYQPTLAAQGALTDALEGAGLGASRAIVVAVVGRLLHSATDKFTDAWFDGLNRTWALKERLLGTPIDPRVFAYLMMEMRPVHRRLSLLVEAFTGEIPAEVQLFARVQDFLLQGCHDSCPQCLANTNRFVGNVRPSRELARQWIASGVVETPVVAVQTGWFDKVKTILETHDQVEITSEASDLPDVARALQTLVGQTFERDYLKVWPVLSRVTQDAAGWRIGVEVRGLGAG